MQYTSIREKLRAGVYRNTFTYEPSKETRDAYHAEESRLTEMFKTDLYEEYGVSDNPKRNVLFSKAWSMGHSSGLNEVLNYFDDLVELIQ